MTSPRHGRTGAREEVVWSGREGRLRLGDFEASPGESDFGTFGKIGDLPAIAFGRTSVDISAYGREPFLSDTMVAVLHNPRRPYERSAVHPEGDICHWINVSLEILEEIGCHWPRSRAASQSSWVHLPGRALLLLRWAVAAARAHPLPILEIEAALLEVVRLVLDPSLEVRQRSPARLRNHETRQDPLVREARAVLTTQFEDRISVRGLARLAGCSEGHLSRAFRRSTGFPPHRYLLELRLREAISRLTLGSSEISPIAHDLGFSSHSHFTEHFRRRFGLPPSTLRRAAEEGDLSALSPLFPGLPSTAESESPGGNGRAPRKTSTP